MYGICGNGTCVNEGGTYSCDCDIGFENHMLMQMCVGESGVMVTSNTDFNPQWNKLAVY